MKRILLVLSAMTFAAQGFAQGGNDGRFPQMFDDCFEGGEPPAAGKTTCAQEITELDSNGYLVNAETSEYSTMDTLIADGTYNAENKVSTVISKDLDADATELAPLEEIEADCDPVIENDTDVTDCTWQLINGFDKDGRPLHLGWRIRWKKSGAWYMREIIIRHLAMVFLHSFCGTNGGIRKMLKWVSPTPAICEQCTSKFSAGPCRVMCNLVDDYFCPNASSSPTPTPPAPTCNLTGVLDPATVCGEDGSSCTNLGADCNDFCLATLDAMKADPANGCKK